MDRVEIAKKFFSLVDKKDWDGVRNLLSDDFYFWSPLPKPLNREEWIEAQKSIYKAFPDWSFHLMEVIEEGNCVNASIHVSGTHLNTLHLPIPGSVSVPPTGLKIEFPIDKAVITFDGDKILEIALEYVLLEGFKGVFQQLGLE